jgi:hypothetical protein
VAVAALVHTAQVIMLLLVVLAAVLMAFTLVEVVVEVMQTVLMPQPTLAVVVVGLAVGKALLALEVQVALES